ncbi:hypothetical protein [Mucilaginibacter sp. UYCu711]|uniref:hypothetical protein n=1 Tax=Mucilaginibacter sp. UYCu711 TaxID=3156339 RepID=UPI003D25D1A3
MRTFDYYRDKPMPINDTSIYFIIAILGLAYPISLGVVTRLDEKYKSVTIVQLFRRCIEFRAFQSLMIAAIAVAAVQIIWIVNWKPFPVDKPQFFFHDWVEILLSIVTGLLLISFFLFTRRVFQFYVPPALAAWLRRQSDNEDRLIFKALTVLLFFGIDIQDAELVATLRAHFGQLFINWRTETGEEPVKYPVAYYEMVYDTIYRSSKSDYWKVRNVGFAAASGRWLIGSREHSMIDELTYAWLWNNLTLMLRLDREDFVEEFWQNSHQLVTTALAPLPWDHDHENPRLILNQQAVDQRERERQQFFEFHVALGGMLLFEKRYELLKRLFNHTTSIPVRYELMPLTMNMVLNLFFRFWTNDGLFYIGRYQFPGQDGIQGEFLSRQFIAKYTALLFIRQYFLVSQWYGYEPVSQPQGPRTQEERTIWIQQLPYFKKLLEEIQKNKKLLDTLGYEVIDENWAALHNKPTPAAIINELIEQTEAAYAAAEVEQRAEADKKTTFRETSARIIEGRIESYHNILNEQLITAQFESSRIKGGYMLYQKAAFSRDQGVTYMNYDSFFAGEITSGFTRELTGLFRSKAVQTYLFRAPQFFEAIDRLHLNPRLHVLLNFGISIEDVLRQHGIDRLTENTYKGIPILKVDHVDHSAMRSSFIVIKKADLPSFVFHQPEEAEIDRFDLTRVSQAVELYAAVVDLNEQPQLKPLFPNEKPDVLATSVILALELNVEVRWKNKAKLVRLALYSDFYQQGSVNDLSEVKRF